MSDPTAEQALALVKSEPRTAIELAQGIVSGASPSVEKARAYWALGLASHELGRNTDALEYLKLGRELAPRELACRIDVSRSAVESAMGMTNEALARLATMIDHEVPGIAGLAVSQRGLIRLYAGEAVGALDDLESSLPLLEQAGDELPAIARVRSNIGFGLTLLGRYQEAVASLKQALVEAEATQQATVAAAARQNLGYAQAQLGELPQALHSLEQARVQQLALGDVSRLMTALYDDLAETYRLAGLTSDAVRYARVASWTARQSDNVERQAFAEYRRAVCLLEHGNAKSAVDAGSRAASLFDRIGRDLWRQRAELVAAEASTADDLAPDQLERITTLVESLTHRGQLNESRRLVNRVAHRLVDSARTAEAHRLLTRQRRTVETASEAANEGTGSESILDKLEVSYQQVLTEAADGGDPQLLLAEARALIGEHNLSLGDQELRAGAARLTERFRSLALRQALATTGESTDGTAGQTDSADQARAIVQAEEEWRAIALNLPRAVAPNDDETAELLVELRKANRTESDSDDHDTSHDAAQSAQHRADRRADLEDQLRLRSMTARSSTRPSRLADSHSGTRSIVDHTVNQLVDSVAIEWIEHQGALVGVRIAPDGSLRMWTAGTQSEALRLSRFIHQSLGDINLAANTETAAAALADLTEDCAELRSVLWPDEPDPWLERSADEHSAPAHPLVLSPPVALMALPWRLIAGSDLAPADVTLTPSIEHWHRRKLTPTSSDALFDSAAVIAGPGLSGVVNDEAVVKRVLPHVDVIGAGEAACERVKDVLTSARYVHLACHGLFRPESPRFSSLTMADGPLTLFELDWLERVPDVVMLAACDSGKVSTRPGGELLGTAPALLASGASTVIAPICPVRDSEVSEVLVPFYEALHKGPSAAARVMDEALLGERPELIATASAFQVTGASLQFES